MARKQPAKRTRGATRQKTSAPDSLAARQGNDDYKVGPGCPPKEYQFKSGESGNPKGNVKHRTHLWEYFTKYMAMTADKREKIDRTRLTAAQETALMMVEKAVTGEGCRTEHLARYIIDREEGKAVEHLIIDDGADLSDEECEELRKLIQGDHAGDGHNTD